MKLIKHLEERGMNTKLYRFARNYSTTCITFYLWNMSGQMVGYQSYRPDKFEKKTNNPKLSRYFSRLKEKDGVFGLDVLNPADRTIYIVEGVFKAAVLHRLGYNAVAVLTSTPKRLKPWFKIMRQTWNIIAIGDNDDGGKQLVDIVGRGFQSPIDIDEMPDEDIIELLRGCNTP